MFCRGVPVSTILLLVVMEFMALDTADASFFRICPSSHITKSGPGIQQIKKRKKKKLIMGGKTAGNILEIRITGMQLYISANQ